MGGLIGIGQSGLSAAYAQLQTTGHNIANVNTPGYVRQEVLLGSAGGMYTGAGFLGRGVEVIDVARRYSQHLARELTTSTSLAAGDAARAKSLEQLDNLLADTDSGLGAAMDGLRTALADVVNRPDDPGAREVVVRRAAAMAEQFRSTDTQLQKLGGASDMRFRDNVDSVNRNLQSIGELNQQIAAANKGTGSQPPDLLDMRDRLIDQVASSLQVTRMPQPDGSVSLFAASGHALVLGKNASSLVMQSDPLDPSRTRLAFQVNGVRIPADAAALGSGELAGLMRFRDQDLAAAQARVGQMAAALAGAYNKQQALGVDPRGDAGAPLFGTAAPVALPAADNLGTFQMNVAVTDPSKLRATDYLLTFDGASYQMRSTADGMVTDVGGTLPVSVDGLEISYGSGSMTIGDRVLIKGASRFASEMGMVLPTGSGLATAYPASVSLDSANAGSLSLEKYAQTTPDPAAAQPVTLEFTSPTTYNVVVGGTVVSANLPYSPGAPISYNGWTLSLRGTPVAGDKVGLSPTNAPGMDNRNARAMVSLGEQPLVDGASFTDAFASLVADVGSRTVQGQAAAETSGAVLKHAKTSFAAESGVNLDEEAANLLQYQQAYQASARIIATANAMFDAVLSVIGS